MQMRSISIAIASLLASTTLHAAPNAAATNRAQGLIDSHPGWVNRASGDTFVQKDAIVDSSGDEHVRFERLYNGLPVIGGDVVVHSKNGNLKQTSFTLKTRGRPGLAARISSSDAQVIAGTDFGGEIDSISDQGLVVYAVGDTPVLAREIRVEGMSAARESGRMRYFIDANSGKILDSWSMIQTAAASGTGKSLLYGNVGLSTNSVSNGYQLVDTTRGNGSVYDNGGRSDRKLSTTLFTDADNTWGNNTESDRATVAADIAYGVATTWDFYKNVMGRNGIFNDGKGVKSYAHVTICGSGGCTPNNAAWNGSGMEYGDGGTTWYPLVAIDVAGHEMSHGVTQATAGLNYSGESGGLNESNSDIMGSMVEYYANNASDPGDYLIGEKLYRSNPNGTSALRYMFKPSADGTSPDCYTSTVGSLNVHYSSGIGNHFYYLLAEGAVTPTGFSYTPSQLVCNGNTAAGGIGRDAAEKIWYRALTVYMTSTTNYAGARTATLNAARDLYGATSTQYNGVASAWSAVSVN